MKTHLNNQFLSFNGVRSNTKSIIKKITPQSLDSYIPFKPDSSIDPMALKGPEAVELPIYPAEYAIEKGVNFDSNI